MMKIEHKFFYYILLSLIGMKLDFNHWIKNIKYI